MTDCRSAPRRVRVVQVFRDVVALGPGLAGVCASAATIALAATSSRHARRELVEVASGRSRRRTSTRSSRGGFAPRWDVALKLWLAQGRALRGRGSEPSQDDERACAHAWRRGSVAQTAE